MARLGPGSLEVAGAAGGGDGEGGEAFGEEVGDAGVLLDGAPDQQGGGVTGRAALGGEDSGRADHVDVAGLVLEGDEDHATGGGGALAGGGASRGAGRGWWSGGGGGGGGGGGRRRGSPAPRGRPHPAAPRTVPSGPPPPPRNRRPPAPARPWRRWRSGPARAPPPRAGGHRPP